MLRLADLSVDLTIDVVNRLDTETVTFETQDASLVTLAPRIQKQDGIIQWNQSAAEIDCHVRAMNPWPKACTWLHADGRRPLRCILSDVEPVNDAPATAGTPGSIDVTRKQLHVHAGNGVLNVVGIQPEGKKAMDGVAFLNGYGVGPGSCFRSEG